MIKVRKNMALWGAALALLGVEKPWLASVPAGQGQPDPCSGSASMPAARSPRTGIVLPKKVIQVRRAAALAAAARQPGAYLTCTVP